MAQYFVVDTFSPVPFNGNPTAVVLIDKSNKVDKDLEQNVANELNLNATAFPTPLDTDDFQTAKRFSLKWFTPYVELQHCGNGTLATAHVLSSNMRNPAEDFEFETHMGTLKACVEKHGFIKLTLPAVKIYSLAGHKQELTDKFEKIDDRNGIGNKIAQELIPPEIQINQLVYSPQLKYLLIALDQSTTHEQFTSLKPSREKLLSIDPNGDTVRAVIVTFHFIPSDQPAVKSFLALTTQPDYILRVFEPWSGFDEYPATGIAQCVASEFWSVVYNRFENLRAHQYHPTRSSEFRIGLVNDKIVEISGQALTVFSGTISDRCLK